MRTTLGTAPAPDRLDSLKRLVILRVNWPRVSSAVSIRCSSIDSGAVLSRFGLQETAAAAAAASLWVTAMHCEEGIDTCALNARQCYCNCLISTAAMQGRQLGGMAVVVNINQPKTSCSHLLGSAGPARHLPLAACAPYLLLGICWGCALALACHPDTIDLSGCRST
jgi:hypothetical protein